MQTTAIQLTAENLPQIKRYFAKNKFCVDIQKIETQDEQCFFSEVLGIDSTAYVMMKTCTPLIKKVAKNLNQIWGCDVTELSAVQFWMMVTQAEEKFTRLKLKTANVFAEDNVELPLVLFSSGVDYDSADAPPSWDDEI